MIRRNFSEKLLEWRYKLVESYLPPETSVLDLGCGTGWVAKRIQERKRCDVKLVDVLDCNETDLDLKLYDGKNIPYPDNAFDTTLLLFVLHHTLNQYDILKEAARVSRKRVIVVEDTPKNQVERLIDSSCDTLMSMEHGFFNPANYKTIEEWQAIFNDLNFSLVDCKPEKPFFPFYYTKCVFALDVPKNKNQDGKR